MTTPLERNKPYVFGVYWASNYVDAAQNCDLLGSLGGGYAVSFPKDTTPNPRYEYRYVELQVTIDSPNVDLSELDLTVVCDIVSLPAGQDSLNFYLDDFVVREDILIPEGCPITPPVQDPNPGTPSPPDPPAELLVNPGIEDANTGPYAWTGSFDLAIRSSFGVQNAHTGTKFL